MVDSKGKSFIWLLVIFLCFIEAYRLTGNLWHEIGALVLCGLFVWHGTRHIAWFSMLGKGASSRYRRCLVLVNILLLLALLLSMITGVMVSHSVFGFLGLHPSGIARLLHKSSSYMVLILAGAHFGLCGRNLRSRFFAWLPGGKAGIGCISMVFCYGIFALVSNNLILKILCQRIQRGGVPAWRQPWDYLAVFLAACLIFYFIAQAILPRKEKSE